MSWTDLFERADAYEVRATEIRERLGERRTRE